MPTITLCAGRANQVPGRMGNSSQTQEAKEEALGALEAEVEGFLADIVRIVNTTSSDECWCFFVWHGKRAPRHDRQGNPMTGGRR